MTFTAANLLWQRRFRGLMPAGQRAVDDAGAALLIKPDELEHRTYQLLVMSPDTSHRELHAISVEKIYKFDGLPDGRFLVGITDDDLYLFRDGRKTRFMADRRTAYADFSLSPETACFVTGYSNPVFAAHGMAYGDGNGRLGWTKDLPSAVQRVAITHDGRFIAAALADSKLLLLDNLRAGLWESVLEETVTALTLPGQAPQPVVGCESGCVAALDDDGGFRWRSNLGLPVRAVVTSAREDWTVAALSNGTEHRLVVLSPEGVSVAEHDLDTAPTGLALSPNGRYLLITGASGLAVCFELDLAATEELRVGGRRHRSLQEARALVASGQPGEATAQFELLLADSPWDVELADEWQRCLDGLVLTLLQQADAALQAGDPAAALECLRRLQERAPWHAELAASMAGAQRALCSKLEERARELEAAAEWLPAAAAWLEIIRLDPTLRSAREGLLRVRTSHGAELLRLGDEREQAGDLEGAVAYWEQARQLSPDHELETRLRRAEITRCLALGMAHYDAQRMPEAEFQFRKVLSLDPHHETAQRYLGYAGGMTGDTLIQDRFARLE